MLYVSDNVNDAKRVEMGFKDALHSSAVNI